MTPPELYAYLDGMGISYEVEEHAPVFTIDEMRELGIKGSVCKNLFLRDAKGRQHFLVVLPGDRQADLGALAAALGYPLLLDYLLAAGDGQRLRGHLLGDGGAGRGVRVVPDPHRGDQAVVAADEGVVPDDGAVLAVPVVIGDATPQPKLHRAPTSLSPI